MSASILAPGRKPDWRIQAVEIHGSGRTVSVVANTCGTLAVHQIVGAQSFGITCRPVGMLMVWHGRVFNEQGPALRVAGQLLEFTSDWTPFFLDPMPDAMQRRFEALMKQADGRGELVRL